ncbi:ArdC-like ssDNA-binding domain-containing protein [Gulosibacter molinativorax]|uniref:ArdC-like ssDNA-binding domain-containing protein n=1 Tax=Gulosibacter molinativorax TaxID=256821 RepID=UPI000D0B3A93|nr:ArdC-like ssDNA-binding domain-containing protein [Gulosibacter molinativorax]QUY63939.1 Plasmid;metallo-endopeptidase;pCM2 [Gulosibacter molinativorax]
MARKIKTTKTAEQRRAEADALHESIAQQVEALRDSDAWQRFLDFAQAFHTYSLNNVLLILGQMPNATRVAGFRKWQQLGRQVRKGERALKIFGFRERKAKADEETEEGTLDQLDTGERVVRYFPMLSVFDMSQTDPTDEWQDPTLAQRLDGSDEAGIYAATRDYLTAQGWTVTREAIPGEVNGYTTTDGSRRVVVDAALSDAQAAKTILHEAAHVILHSAEEHAEYVAHRGLKECEAESVAYIVAGIIGLDTTAYSIGYVAGWTDGDTDTIKQTAANVLRAAHKIADAITTDEEQEDEAQAA